MSEVSNTLPPYFLGHCRAGTGNAELHMLGGALRMLQIKVNISAMYINTCFFFSLEGFWIQSIKTITRYTICKYALKDAFSKIMTSENS